MTTEAKKVGLVESDIVALINWKKADAEHRKKMVCNQLSLVDDFMMHDFWWTLKGVNKELYWELQYEWRDHYYFNTGVFKDRAKSMVKHFRFWQFKKYILTLISLSYIYVDWLMWERTVNLNYQIYVKLPYFIRNGKPSEK